MSVIDQLAIALEAQGDVKRAEPLSRHTTFGIGGPADLYVTVRETAALERVATLSAEAGVNAFVLGSGSNILVSDRGIRGVVIDNRAREETADDGETTGGTPTVMTRP